MLIKKVFLLFLIISLFPLSAFASEYPSVSADAAVVMDCSTGEILYSLNPHKRLSMASTTKIMTSIIAIESGKMNVNVTADKDIICDGTSIGIEKGNTFKLETLIYAMLLESGNDAAMLTAEFLGGSESEFAEMMNEKAKSLGMENSNFVTSSGLDAEEHYSTAYDMAILGSYAVNNPVFRNMCSKKTETVHYISPEISRTYSNHNKLINMYDGVFGVKTGFTRKSGRCLVSACEQNGAVLVAVTLNAPDDWNDHISMFDYCFDNISDEVYSPVIPDNILIYGGMNNKVGLFYPEITVNASNRPIKYTVSLPSFIYAPINKGDIVGNITLYYQSGKTDIVAITASERVFSLHGKDTPEINFTDKLKYVLTKTLKG